MHLSDTFLLYPSMLRWGFPLTFTLSAAVLSKIIIPTMIPSVACPKAEYLVLCDVNGLHCIQLLRCRIFMTLRRYIEVEDRLNYINRACDWQTRDPESSWPGLEVSKPTTRLRLYAARQITYHKPERQNYAHSNADIRRLESSPFHFNLYPWMLRASLI